MLCRAGEEGDDLSGQDLRGANLVGRDLTCADLSGANLQGASLKDAILRSADLSGTDLAGADLYGADLRGALVTTAIWDGTRCPDGTRAWYLGIDSPSVPKGTAAISVPTSCPMPATKAEVFRLDRLAHCPPDAVEDLSDRDLTGADFSERDLICADFSGANLSGVNLSNANLMWVDLTGADLTGANLFLAAFSGAVVAGTRWGGTTCSDGSLAEREISGPGQQIECPQPSPMQSPTMVARAEVCSNGTMRDLSLENMSGADLAGEDLSCTNLSFADLSSANLKGANLAHSVLWGANLDGADLRSADLTYTLLKEADLRTSNLLEANLESADLQGVDFRGSELPGVNLSDTYLKDVNFDGANLRGAVLAGAHLQNASARMAFLNSANVSGADLRFTDLTGADISGANIDDTLWGPDTRCGDGGFPWRPGEIGVDPADMECPGVRPVGAQASLPEDYPAATAVLDGVYNRGVDIAPVKTSAVWDACPRLIVEEEVTPFTLACIKSFRDAGIVYLSYHPLSWVEHGATGRAGINAAYPDLETDGVWMDFDGNINLRGGAGDEPVPTYSNASDTWLEFLIGMIKTQVDAGMTGIGFDEGWGSLGPGTRHRLQPGGHGRLQALSRRPLHRRTAGGQGNRGHQDVQLAHRAPEPRGPGQASRGGQLLAAVVGGAARQTPERGGDLHQGDL